MSTAPSCAPPVPPPVRRHASARRIEMFGILFDGPTFEEALERLTDLARGTNHSYVVTVNVDHVVRLRRRPELLPIYRDADLVLADGMPLIWASRLMGQPLPVRVAGSDLLPALCARAAQAGLSVFLLGGDPGAANEAARILKNRHPNLRLAGTYCPPMGFERDAAERERARETVARAAPDILFVGLGSPKQEQWIVDNRWAFDARLSIGVGVSFSFLSGAVRRAPRWMQRTGLEWAHRLFQEPGRLWRRYLVQDLAFFPLLAREMWNRITRPPRPPRSSR